MDTGATSVALSARQASQLGIDYRQGRLSTVTTASGRAKAYQVTLKTVAVGSIVVSAVPAVVVEGDYPAIILLGMTYLRHVEMSEKDGLLVLQAKF